LDDEGRFRASALGSDQGWDHEQLATFFGHERLLRGIISGNVPTELPSSAVPEAASLEVLQGCASNFVVVIPLRGESGPLGACVLASRLRHANQQGFLRFAAGVSNQITQVLALTSALAEKEKLRREASEQARLMRLILDNMAEGVLVVDRERRVLLQNKSTLSLVPALGGDISERAASLDMCRADGKTPLDYAMGRYRLGFLENAPAPKNEMAAALRKLGATKESPDAPPLPPGARPVVVAEVPALPY
jgi:PAS domain-containing protein